jgi:hypothetical protein
MKQIKALATKLFSRKEMSPEARFEKAVKSGNIQAVEAALDKNPALLAADDHFPIYVASVRGDKQLVEFLIEKGSPVTERAAAAAVRYHHPALINLYQKREDVNMLRATALANQWVLQAPVWPGY